MCCHLQRVVWQKSWRTRRLRETIRQLVQGHTAHLLSSRVKHNMGNRKQWADTLLTCTYWKDQSRLSSIWSDRQAACSLVWYPCAIFLVCASTPSRPQFARNNDELPVSSFWVRKGVHFSIHDVVEELAPWRILHHDENVLLSFNNFVHLSNRWVLRNL